MKNILTDMTNIKNINFRKVVNMKKIILLLAGILVFLTGCGKNLDQKSLNGLLEYKLIDGWQNMSSDISTIAEIAVQKEDTSIGLMAEYTEYFQSKPEDFIAFQENSFKQSGAIFEEEFSLDEKGRKIYGKSFKASAEDEKNKFVAGIMEIEKNKDAYISFVATLIDAENGIEQIEQFLSTVNFTGKTLNEATHFIPEREYFELDLPAQYRKSSRNKETSFIKTLDNGVLYASLTTLSKENLSPQQEFENLDKGFNETFAQNEVYKEESVENFDDIQIQSKIYKYSLNGSNAYSYFSVIDFTNTNLMVVCVYDVLIDGDFAPIEKELNDLTKSVKLKKDAEKILKKDLEKLKKQIEKNQKELEKQQRKIEKEQEKESVSEEISEQTTEISTETTT